MNTQFNVPGLAGMTSTETAGMIFLIFLIFCVGMCMIAYGVASSRRGSSRHTSGWDDVKNLRSVDRTYDPVSDAGFGARQVTQDPAGYWRTAQPYESPIGVARVRRTATTRYRQEHQPLHATSLMPAQRLAISARQAPARHVSLATPNTGYRIDPRENDLLGLREHVTAHVAAPVSPPMYPPMTQAQFDSIVPTSPPMPSAYHYRPMSIASDAYAPGAFDPAASSMPASTFNPLMVQPEDIKPEVKVSLGRHSWLSNTGTDSQRAALRDNTMALPIIDMQTLLAVG